jgi:hypothetical protein
LDGLLTRYTDLQHSQRTTAGGRIRRLISIETVKDLRDILSDRLSEKALTQILGLKPQRVRQLVHFGYFAANDGWFSRVQVLEFVRELFLSPIREDTADATWMPLSEVLRRSIPMRLTGDFFEALRQGTVSHSISGSLIELRAMAINVEQLNRWRSVVLTDCQEWFSIPDAARQLGLKDQVAYELVAIGLLKCKKRVVKNRLTRAISAKDICSFTNEYVALSHLIAEQNINPKDVYAWAVSSGLSVVSGPIVDGCRKYFVKIPAQSSSRK